MDRIIAAGGLTVAMEAMLNHPVLKKDEISVATSYEPDHVIRYGLNLLYMMTRTSQSGHEERRVTLRKAGVLQALVPVVAAFTKAEIEAGMKPGVVSTARLAHDIMVHLVGTERLHACFKGEGPLSDMLTEEDMMVLVGTMEEPGFMCKAQLPG